MIAPFQNGNYFDFTKPSLPFRPFLSLGNYDTYQILVLFINIFLGSHNKRAHQSLLYKNLESREGKNLIFVKSGIKWSKSIMRCSMKTKFGATSRHCAFPLLPKPELSSRLHIYSNITLFFHRIFFLGKFYFFIKTDFRFFPCLSFLSGTNLDTMSEGELYELVHYHKLGDKLYLEMNKSFTIHRFPKSNDFLFTSGN